MNHWNSVANLGPSVTVPHYLVPYFNPQFLESGDYEYIPFWRFGFVFYFSSSYVLVSSLHLCEGKLQKVDARML